MGRDVIKSSERLGSLFTFVSSTFDVYSVLAFFGEMKTKIRH